MTEMLSALSELIRMGTVGHACFCAIRGGVTCGWCLEVAKAKELMAKYGETP